MGANLCCSRRSCVRGPAAAAESGDGYAMCEWRRLQWRRREKTEVKREKEAWIEKKQYMSLEELMLASPGASSERGFGSGGGEFNASSRGGFKRKVHPVRIANRSLFCERSMNESVAEDEYSGGDFSICRSESRKMMKKKKKVSFRLPEVSDVIVIYSPAAYASADNVNVAS